MPFAPIILHEYQNELIKNSTNIESPHMTIAFETINGKEKILLLRIDLMELLEHNF